MELLQQPETSVHLLYLAEGGGSTNNHDGGFCMGTVACYSYFLIVSAYKDFSYSQVFASFILGTKEGFEITLTLT